MKIPDTNLLIYAVGSGSTHHAASRRWLSGALSGGAPVGFAWVALLGFVRIVTNPRIVANPLTHAQATALVQAWLAAPTATVLHPGPGHADALAAMLAVVDQGGNLVNDAHLAALAIEHKATVVTFDSDFSRFPGLRFDRPR